MKIRKAKQDDVESVKNMMQHPVSTDELTRSLNPFFMVADSSDGLKGFSLGYRSDFFRRVFEDGEYTWFNYLLDNTRGDFIYLDQIGAPGWKGFEAGMISRYLLDTSFELARTQGAPRCLTYICNDRNNGMHNLCLENSFFKVTEVPIENGAMLGLYEKSLV